MDNSTRVCKICGKEYPYCRTSFNNNIFRWQDVACCAEHGSEYFARVAASRAESSPKEPEVVLKNSDILFESFEDSDDDMDFFENDEDEDEDI